MMPVRVTHSLNFKSQEAPHQVLPADGVEERFSNDLVAINVEKLTSMTTSGHNAYFSQFYSSLITSLSNNWIYTAVCILCFPDSPTEGIPDNIMDNIYSRREI